MVDALPTFDELYAVSDIHLGGTKTPERNFQIFNRGERLAGFIDSVRESGANEKGSIDVALVVNGDLIDSLAEDDVMGYVALSEKEALQMMDRLWTDPSFSMVWDALRSFVRTPRRHLIIVVGNHDIELALPVVQADLRKRLGGDDSLTQTRLQFATQGAGFACRVGKARVFCTHGNEVDKMNWVDYNLLGQLGNAINAGRTADANKWKPNGGTKLVVEVMNIVKERYPFVDLLKPETAAIAGVLAAIDCKTFCKVDLCDAFPIVKAALRGRSITNELLGVEEGEAAGKPPVPAEVADAVLNQVLGPRLREAIRQGGGTTSSEDDLLLHAGQSVATGAKASAALQADAATETLGTSDMMAGMLGLVPKREALRRALQDWLSDDTTYDVSSPKNDGELFEAMKSRVAFSVDFTITGHTHLARALRFDDGGYYYNCGTWIRLLKLTTQVLDSSKAFEDDVWPALTAGTMDALDTARIAGRGGDRVPLLEDRTNAVRIRRDGAVIKGDLLRISGDSRQNVTIDVEPRTQTFERK